MSEDINSVLTALSTFYKELKQKQSLLDKTTQTSYDLCTFCKLPKNILFKILSFLDFQLDVTSLSETCKFFHTLLGSYAVQLIFYKQSTRKHEMKAEKEQTELELKAQDSISAMSREEILARYGKSVYLREKLSFMLEKAENSSKELLSIKNKLSDEVTLIQLRIQKQINHKTIKKRNLANTEGTSISAQTKRLNLSISAYKEEHQATISSLTASLKLIEKEKQVLRRHIRTLAAGADAARSYNHHLSRRLSQSLFNLSKLKSYCNERFIFHFPSAS
jgi:hypothetical protein